MFGHCVRGSPLRIDSSPNGKHVALASAAHKDKRCELVVASRATPSRLRWDARCISRHDQHSKGLMKSEERGHWRISAAALIVSLFLPFAALIFAVHPDQDALLPACCRKNGKHQCFMRRVLENQGGAGSSSPRVAQLVEKCPFAPGFTHSATDNLLGHESSLASTVLWEVGKPELRRLGHSHVLATYRANHKRGPPTFASLP